ncbi:uncharacterized protein LOC113285348 isoform X1 [Papaver somniferum]|uniref:uncharacterized protein LOC113285348 isoform X1 n=1 Tax=Papaver somniferum TaxID=3469 RepID=UPI000E6FB020|nr:uncharacterized protein LOC113285348 isoform X1 [Papaver somniferum]
MAAASYSLMNNVTNNRLTLNTARRNHNQPRASASLNIINQNSLSHLRFSIFSANQGLSLSTASQRSSLAHRKLYKKMDATVYASVQPGLPVPTPSPSGSNWKGWILGAFLSIILPLLRHKSPLLTLKSKVDMVVGTIDTVAEVIEMVAEGVEKVADQVADQLPEGHLKGAIECVESIAHEAAKDAHLADQFLDKIVEVEEGLLKKIESKETVEAQKQEDEAAQ